MLRHRLRASVLVLAGLVASPCAHAQSGGGQQYDAITDSTAGPCDGVAGTSCIRGSSFANVFAAVASHIDSHFSGSSGFWGTTTTTCTMYSGSDPPGPTAPHNVAEATCVTNCSGGGGARCRTTYVEAAVESCGGSGQPLCTPPPGCNTSSPTIGQTFTGTDSTMTPHSYCHAVDNCMVNVVQQQSASGTVVYVGTETSQNCSSGTPSDSANSTTSAESCHTTGSGVTVCVNPTGGGQCGDLNGEFVCLKSTPPGGCQVFASGAKVCDSTAGTPPVPDNGTKGQPATPTTQIGQSVNGGSATTYNYYSSSTVSGSSATGNGTSPTTQAGQGTSGSGSGASAANGDCGATGVNCAGDSTVPTLPTQQTIAQSTSDYVGSLSSVPIVASVSNIASAIPSGTCPTATLSVFGHSYQLDEQCTLYNSISAVLSAVFLAMWALLGVRILMSA